MSKSGYEAYGAVHKKTLSGRALEGEAFLRAVQLLQRAQDYPDNRRFWIEALDYTRKLWTIVQADISQPDHHLERTMRDNLLSLSLYVDKQCVAAAKKPHPQLLQGLIDVNSNLARGLLGTGNAAD